ncbi:hypothetical protein [Vallitalea guaymasensis]|uniref:hypothetical protein n=1 Tax=Vallitalea guaymasensis TaxID=1185412 RepID=UPI000DE257CA|nr:hypothetical protein [Vallitalea guaymasensis]
MKDMGIINCSTTQAVPLIIGKDTVYVHSEIEQVFEDNQGNPTENLWKCHEIQYEKDEYIKILSEKNSSLAAQLTDTQLALVEIYEGMVV